MRKHDRYITGIEFWTGGEAFSIIKIIKILTYTNILNYDFITTGVAAIFILFCPILIRKNKMRDTGNIKATINMVWFFGWVEEFTV